MQKGPRQRTQFIVKLRSHLQMMERRSGQYLRKDFSSFPFVHEWRGRGGKITVAGLASFKPGSQYTQTPLCFALRTLWTSQHQVHAVAVCTDARHGHDSWQKDRIKVYPCVVFKEEVMWTVRHAQFKTFPTFETRVVQDCHGLSKACLYVPESWRG